MKQGCLVSLNLDLLLMQVAEAVRDEMDRRALSWSPGVVLEPIDLNAIVKGVQYKHDRRVGEDGHVWMDAGNGADDYCERCNVICSPFGGNGTCPDKLTGE